MKSLALTALACCALVACATEARDLSNATATITNAEFRTPNNVHAVREVQPTPLAESVLAQPDRSAADRALDARKQAADLLTFVDARPGMHAAELGCGNGYFTELLARAVGPTGVLFAQNSTGLMSKAAIDGWRSRLARSSMKRVVVTDRPFHDPLPRDAEDLDLVYLGVHYGLLTKYDFDRAATNHAVFSALRSGGRYVVMDWTLPSPISAARSQTVMHTEESRSTRREIEAAGFLFVSEGRFLRTSPYADDWDAAQPWATVETLPRAHKSDVFVLVFAKP